MSKRQSMRGGASGSWDETDTGLIAKFKADFADAVNSLDSAVALIPVRQNEMLDVMDYAAQDPQTADDWQTQWDKLQTAQTAADNGRAAVAQVSSWWDSAKRTFGLSGGVGVLPFVIPFGVIGTILAAAAAISAVLYSSALVVDSLRTKRWSDASVQAQLEGKPPIPQPLPAAGSGNVVTKFFEGAGDTVKWALVAAGAYLLLSRR